MYACMHVCICVISARQKASRKSAMSSYKKKKNSAYLHTHTHKKKYDIKYILFLFLFFFCLFFTFQYIVVSLDKHTVEWKSVKCVVCERTPRENARWCSWLKKKKHPLLPTAIPKKLSVVRFFFFLMLPYLFIYFHSSLRSPFGSHDMVEIKLKTVKKKGKKHPLPVWK